MRGYPEQVYKAIIATPGEVVAAQPSQIEPPVAVEERTRDRMRRTRCSEPASISNIRGGVMR
jgi:hypothetical protein